MTVCREFFSDECKNEIRFKKFLVLCTNHKFCVYLPESQTKKIIKYNLKLSNPSVSYKFFWASTDAHSPVVGFLTDYTQQVRNTETFGLWYSQQVNNQ